MGLFGGVIKKAVGAVTGGTAARQAQRAGESQARAIEVGLRAQQAQKPLAIRDVVRGARQAGAELRPWRGIDIGAVRQMQQMLRAPLPQYTPGAAFEPVEYVPPTAEEVAASPAVRFRMQEAQRAAERGAAARGRLLGGGAQRELARYMQGLASQEYGAEAQRRMQAAQLGAEQQMFGARLAEEQAQFAPQIAQREMAQRLTGLTGLAGMGFEATQQRAGLRERLGHIMSGIRTGSGAAQAAALQAAGQARASGALAGAAARQQAMGNLMRLGGTLGTAAMGGM